MPSLPPCVRPRLACGVPLLLCLFGAAAGCSHTESQSPATTIAYSTDDPKADVRLEVAEDTDSSLRVRVVAQGIGRVHSVALRLAVDPSVLAYRSIEPSDAFQSDGVKSLVIGSAKATGEVWIGAALPGAQSVDTTSAVLVAQIAFSKLASAQARIAVLPEKRMVLDDTGQPIDDVSWSGITGKASQVAKASRAQRRSTPLRVTPVELGRLQRSFSRPLPQRALPRLPGKRSGSPSMDVQHMLVNLSVDPSSKTAVSTTTIRVRSGVTSLKDAAFLVYNVWGSLSPEVTVDGTPASSVEVVPYPDYGVTLVQATLPEALALGEEAEVRVQFTSQAQCDEPLLSVSTSFCRVSQDSVYFLDPSFYAIPYDTQNPTAADDWDTDLEVRLPQGLVVAAGGAGDPPKDNGDGTSTHRFVGVHNTVVAFAATKTYRTVSGATSDQKPITGYFLQTTDEEGSWHVGLASQIIDYHASRYVPFVFNSMTLVEIPPEVPVGGIGWPAASFLSATGIAGAKGSPEAAHLLAHELGHQWLGNLLSIDFGSAFWLQEGMTEYAAYDFVRAWSMKETGEDVGARMRRIYQHYYMFGMPSAKDTPLHPSTYDPSDPLAAFLLSYVKGGSVVQSVADQIGQETYLASVKALMVEHGLKDVIGWPELREALEASSGASLGAFETEWLGRPGFPKYEVGYQATRRSDGKVDVLVKLSSEDDYHIPFTIALRRPDGGQEKRVKLSAEKGQRQETFELDFCPEKYELDPDVAYLHLSRTELGGDAYRDGDVDGIDLAYVAFSMGAKAVSQEERTRYSTLVDMDSNGRVDEADLTVLQSGFGASMSCR